MKRYKSLFKEKQYRLSDLDSDLVYDMFSQNYIKATGKTWSKAKFLSRSNNYIFFGDDKGYVMIRPQRSGLYKLVGSAGNPMSITKGLKEANATGKPVWGMVTKDMVKPSQRFGFISPPGWILKQIANQIPEKVFGTSNYKVNLDGSITIDYDDVGKATKYFIANKRYYEWLIDNSGDYLDDNMKNVIKSIIDFGSNFQKFNSIF